MRALRLLCALLLSNVLSGCTTLRFVAQAASGQWELISAARPIPEVIADPTTPELTRQQLSQVEDVRRYAWSHGLRVDANYKKFVQLDREYPVWFVNASAPLAFHAKTFSFPIVGSFPGLAWFDKADAEEFRDQLKAQGWDVNMRGVSAFSTGGYFDDPIVWSMLSTSPGAMAFLVNTVLHESLHATVLVRNEQYFNESLASFVADTMTGEYLEARSGERMPKELAAYLRAKDYGQKRAQELNAVYQELDAVYTSKRSDAEKTEQKKQIIDHLVSAMRLRERPNNATLIGYRLYQVGGDNFSALYAECGRNWRRFLSAVSRVSAADFETEQRADIGPVVDRVRARGCPTDLFPIAPFERPDWRWKTQQRRREEEQRERQTRLRLQAMQAERSARAPAARTASSVPGG